MEIIREKIADYISNSIAATQVSTDENLFESGYVHSLFAIQLIMYIEKEFDIELDEDDLDFDNFSTINDIAEIVFAYLEKKQ